MSFDPVDRWRWTPKRKAALLAEIEAGALGPAQLAPIGLSPEELNIWRREYSEHGVRGLHVYSLHHHHPDRRRGSKSRGC